MALGTNIGYQYWCQQHELCQHWLRTAIDFKWCFNRRCIITKQSQSAVNTNPRIHRWQITLILITIGAKLHQHFLTSALVAYSYCNKLDSHSHKWSILSTSIIIGCKNQLVALQQAENYNGIDHIRRIKITSSTIGGK